MPSFGTRERAVLMLPLEGFLVVSVEQAVAAPLCTARLADAGARVIKIEREGGDFARKYDTAARGESSYFTWINHGKESVVLDIKQSGDCDLLEAIIAKADVFVQNLAPGAMQRAGFSSDSLRDRHSRLITCDISGYGDGPEMDGMKAYDFLVQAESGLVSVSGGPNELGRIGVSVCDIGAGMAAHAAILEALLLRGKTGRGSGVKISLFDVAAEWMTVPLIHLEHGNGAPSRQGLRHPSIAPYGAYRTGDGIDTVISIQNEREWQRLCEQVLDCPDMATDPRFSGNNLRVSNRDAMDNEITTAIATLTATQFRLRLLEASIAFGGLNSVADLSEHRALRRRTIGNATGEPLTMPAAPAFATWSEHTPGQKDVPAIGSSTMAVRAEFLEDSS